jgi:hypothetical protein
VFTVPVAQGCRKFGEEMPIVVTYTIYPSYQDRSVTMCGAFKDREDFDVFAKREVQRECYRKRDFTVEKEQLISDAEYKDLTGSMF